MHASRIACQRTSNMEYGAYSGQGARAFLVCGEHANIRHAAQPATPVGRLPTAACSTHREQK
ncbi:hypothetical protein BDY21DRAFT_343203 [Lineolata rhizophorae]|uniref:Uncharacterized protein n=1 Tax=Lineolata rhizophorae TaxID=578093 RepID=A0A6A6P1N1_9PEZI|nr:hypothetical protein BDY21DRAFT_343203 [Lineolata rhizophorae]